MGLVPFAATMRFENNPAGWGGPEAWVTPPAPHPWTAWWWNGWMRFAWCSSPARLIAVTSGTTCRSLVQLQRSSAVPPALQQFLAYIQQLDMTRISTVGPRAHGFGVAPLIGRGLQFGRS
jgi:hypothetical protein